MTSEVGNDALVRIQEEYLDLKQSLPPGITADLIGGDLWSWEATIEGPEDSPFKDGTFMLKIKFPPNYPFKRPKVTFITPIYHPNVSDIGDICLNILLEKWNPTIRIPKVLLSISQLMCTPFTGHSLRPEIADVYVKDRELYNKTAEEWTKKFAKDHSTMTNHVLKISDS